MLAAHMKLRVTARFFGKICFAPKMGKIKKIVFFEFVKKSIIFIYLFFERAL